MSYVTRALDRRLNALLPEVPAIAIDGTKGVGKTATALQRADTVWMLDREETLLVAAADPDFLTVEAGTFLLDEWQKFPSVWDAVRRQVFADGFGHAFRRKRDTLRGGANSVTADASDGAVRKGSDTTVRESGGTIE